MAKFKQGQSGNPKGRKKGAKNKIAVPIKTQLSEFLNEKIQELPAIWSKLTARDKVQFIKDLLPFYLAKLQAISLEVELEKLTDEQLNLLCEKLFNKK